jgi:hypothetical protein
VKEECLRLGSTECGPSARRKRPRKRSKRQSRVWASGVDSVGDRPIALSLLPNNDKERKTATPRRPGSAIEVIWMSHRNK